MRNIVKNVVVPATLSTVIAASSFADVRRDDGLTPYVGASFGRVDINADDFSNDSDDVYSIYAGMDIGPVFGVELAYTDLGGVQNEFFSTTTDGFEVSGLAHFVNTERFNLYARGGVFFWNTEIDSPLGSADNEGNELFWAVGSDIYLNDVFGIRVEYARYNFELEDEEVGELADGEEFNVNKLSVGIKFDF